MEDREDFNRAPAPDSRSDGDATARWAEAWGRPLDVNAAAAWRRLRDRLDPALEGDPEVEDGTDPGLEDEIRTLIASERQAASWLDRILLTSESSEVSEPSSVETAAAVRAPGRIVADCELLRCVGRGGMGEVHEAIDRSLGGDFVRRVALKLLRHREGGSGGRLSLDRDVAALSRLEHPGIARLYRAGLDAENRPFLVTEFIEGEPLLKFIEPFVERDPRRRIVLAQELGERLADAMAASHAAGVVHRDLKSSNVLVRPDGRVAVVDFGIAAFEEGAADRSETIAERLSMQHDAVGSLGAISPERARGVASGPREDVWAIGVLLHQIATGRRPVDLDGLSLAEALHRVATTAPPPIRTMNSRVPRDLAAVVDRCLAFDPADRYADAGGVRDDLERVRVGLPPQAARIGRAGRTWRFLRRHPAASVLAAATASTLVGGVVVSLSLAIDARRAAEIAEDREQVVRSVADGLLVEVAETLRTIPGATAARQRLLEIGLAYAEAVGDEAFLASDRDAALELARAVFTLGEVHRLQQPNANADDLGREAFARAAGLARLAAEASGDFDAESLGLVARAESQAITGRPDWSLERMDEAWAETIELAESVLEVDPRQADALIGLSRSALRIGDRARLDGDRDRAMTFFTTAVEATTRLVEAHPDMPRAWFAHGASLNSMWWLLYKEFQEGNEARILETFDAMIDAERRENEILPTSNASSAILISQMTRTFLAIEFGLIGLAEAEALLAENEAAIVAYSDADPEIGLLRRRRVEAHLRRGDALAMFVEQFRERGDEAEAQRLAAEAAACFETGAEVQRNRLARREETATNEDALLAHLLEQAKAMRAVAEERGAGSTTDHP
jgi:hypothetical protein